MAGRKLTVASPDGVFHVERRFLSGAEVVLRGEQELSRAPPWGLIREHRFRLLEAP